jgi:hypothetical protein
MFPACAECGMVLSSPNEYHPYAACLMYKGCKDENTVRLNLLAVLHYGSGPTDDLRQQARADSLRANGITEEELAESAHAHREAAELGRTQ